MLSSLSILMADSLYFAWKRMIVDAFIAVVMVNLWGDESR